jgi:hypothetical protein
MAQLSTQDLWAMYVQGIISAQGIPPTSANNFILLGTTTVANLYTGGVGLGTNPTTQQALAQIYELGDQMLNPQGVYSPRGIASSRTMLPTSTTSPRRERSPAPR